MQTSGRNCSPAPDLALWRPISSTDTASDNDTSNDMYDNKDANTTPDISNDYNGNIDDNSNDDNGIVT